MTSTRAKGRGAGDGFDAAFFSAIEAECGCEEGALDVEGERVRDETALSSVLDEEDSVEEDAVCVGMDAGESTISIGTRRRRGEGTGLTSRGVVAYNNVQVRLRHRQGHITHFLRLRLHFLIHLFYRLRDILVLGRQAQSYPEI